MFSQYDELRPTNTVLFGLTTTKLNKLYYYNSWDRSASLGHPSNFQRVSRLGFVTAPTSLNGGQPNFARFWPSSGLVHYI